MQQEYPHPMTCDTSPCAMGVHMRSFSISSCSWSEVWGEQGYIRLLKGANNHCGVANQASFPLL